MVRLVATDMDGTFLRQDQSYDVTRFAGLYARFAERGGRFVAASGKQYPALKRFFPAQQGEMAFIAENGALVMQGDERLYACPLPPDSVGEVARLVQGLGINMLLCAEKRAYMLEGQAEYRRTMSRFYEGITEITLADTGRLGEDIFKFSLLMEPGRVADNFDRLRAALDERFALMSSGFGYLDIMNAGANKGVALEHLCELWGIPYEQRMAFGDAGNDVEMLRRVRHSYAMEGAEPAVLAIATHIAPANGQDGVLTVLEQMLDEGW